MVKNLNFQHFHIWSRDCHRVPDLHLCTKVHQNRMYLRSDIMAILWFSRRWISAILNFRGPIMGSLKSPRTTAYRSSIETVAVDCLLFEKIAFCVGILATDRQIYEQMDRTYAVVSGALIIKPFLRTERPTYLWHDALAYMNRVHDFVYR